MFALEIVDMNSQAIEATLDDVLYYIIINWNQSGSVWELGVRNSAYRILLAGVRMVPEYPLLRQFKYTEIPPGELWVHDYSLTGSQRIPRDGFVANRYQLVYYTSQDILGGELDNVI